MNRMDEEIYIDPIDILREKIKKHGGLKNFHAHADRAYTDNLVKADGLTMIEKQGLTARLHQEHYSQENVEKRLRRFLDDSIKEGLVRVDSFIDVSPFIPDDGLAAINAALKVKKDYEDKIDFRLGAYPILGFKDTEPKNWEIFTEAAKMADFIGTLPERDDYEYYRIGYGHIGFKEHFRRVLKLALELDKPAHFHVDQQNNPHEKGTLTLINSIEYHEFAEELKNKGKEEPFIWAVHVISPSRYSDEKREEVLDGLVRNYVGVHICPDAAISMRQPRHLLSPTSNSIGPGLEMLAKGIQVRLGTDNVKDMFMKYTGTNLEKQITSFADMLRIYDPSILAKLGAGKKLDSEDIGIIKSRYL